MFTVDVDYWTIVTELQMEDGIAWSFYRSVTIVSPAKMAEPIEMPFGL